MNVQNAVSAGVKMPYIKPNFLFFSIIKSLRYKLPFLCTTPHIFFIISGTVIHKNSTHTWTDTNKSSSAYFFAVNVGTIFTRIQHLYKQTQDLSIATPHPPCAFSQASCRLLQARVWPLVSTGSVKERYTSIRLDRTSGIWRVRASRFTRLSLPTAADNIWRVVSDSAQRWAH